MSAAILAILVAGCSGAPVTGSTPRATAPVALAPTPPAPTPPAPTPPPFDRTALSIDDPTSLWVVVNKLRPLQPQNYEPSDLIDADVTHISRPLMRREAAHALERMFAASVVEGGGAMQVQNSYRSYITQASTHQYYVDSIGQAGADAQSARHGYSEHQTGLAVDIAALPSYCDTEQCFGATPQGIWLAANASRFGFLLSYPANKTDETGYIYEPWHFRYVGVSLAGEMRAGGVPTLGEFFGLPPAPDYAK